MSQVIQVENISKSFGDKKALERINFHIDQGEIFGFLGPSGSGKTTLINILTGQLDADNGQSKILGKASDAINAQDLVKIGLVSDTSGFYEKMTLYKNLQIYAKLYDLKNERIDEVLEQVGLLESRNIVAEKLSTGMKQRMFLARALLNNPEVLFLDEPTSGLDPSMREEFVEVISDYMQDDRHTVLFSTHITQDLETIADYIVFIDNGEIVLSLEKEEFINYFMILKCGLENQNTLDPDAILGQKKTKYNIEYLVKRHTIQDIPNEYIEDEITIDKMMILYGREK